MPDKANKVLNNKITEEEAWCFLYDLQTKRQPSKRKLSSSLGKQFRVDREKGKFKLTVF
jgi:hypothetical protein